MAAVARHVQMRDCVGPSGAFAGRADDTAMLSLRGMHPDAEMLKVAVALERRALAQDFAGPSGAIVVRAHSIATMNQLGRQTDALRFSFR